MNVYLILGQLETSYKKMKTTHVQRWNSVV